VQLFNEEGGKRRGDKVGGIEGEGEEVNRNRFEGKGGVEVADLRVNVRRRRKMRRGWDDIVGLAQKLVFLLFAMIS